MGNHLAFDSPVGHSRFSKVQISLSSNSMVIREPLASHSRQIETWLQKKKLYNHIYNLDSLFLCEEYKIETNLYCRGAGIFLGKYQGVYMKTLKDIIEERALEQKYFTEEQIWYFILFVCESAFQIHSYGPNHLIGNIHPSNILVNQRGNYKLIVANHSISFPKLKDSLMQYRINGDSHAYVSPELIGFLSNTKYLNYPNFPRCVNKHMSEAFSLGLTVIAMATLNLSISKIYKKYSRILSKSVNQSRVSIKISCLSKASSRQFDGEDHMNALLIKVKQKYSKILYELVLGLVCDNPENRMNISDIYCTILKPISKNILTFDSNWIQRVNSNQQSDITIDDKLMRSCEQWARVQSNILKDEI